MAKSTNNEEHRQGVLAFIGKNLKARTFNTGSDGFGAYGRTEVIDGEEYQVSVNATRIGSKR